MEELDRLEDEFNNIATSILTIPVGKSTLGDSDANDGGKDPELTTENEDSTIQTKSKNETQKLIELSSHLLDKCKALTEERVNQEVYDDLENQNEMLKQKLEDVEGILGRKEAKIEQISEEMMELESINRSKERQIKNLSRENETQMKDMEERSADFQQNLEDSIGGYSITLTKTPKINRTPENSKFRTFNENKSDYSPETLKLTKVVKNLVNVTTDILNEFRTQQEKFDGQERVLTRVDDEIEKMLKKQQEMLLHQQELSTGVEDMSAELEEHWKLIETITKENKLLNEKVYRVIKTDFPALKNYLMNKSNVMDQTLRKSTVMMNQTRGSIVLQNQLNTLRTSEMAGGPVMDSVNTNEMNRSVDSKSSVDQAPEDIVKLDSLNMRVEGSLESTEFLGMNAGENNDVQEQNKSSILENMDEVSSKSSLQTELISNPRDTFSTNQEDNKDDTQSERSDQTSQSEHKEEAKDSFGDDGKQMFQSTRCKLEPQKTFAHESFDSMVSQSVVKKRGSKLEGGHQQIPLETILERSKRAKNEDTITQSSMMIDHIGHNRSVRASMQHLRRSTVYSRPIPPISEEENHPQNLPTALSNRRIYDNNMYIHMVNTYNHQLKQKYIYDLAAFHVQAESMMRGYQMKTPVAPKGSMMSCQVEGMMSYEEGKEMGMERVPAHHIQSVTVTRKESEIQSFNERSRPNVNFQDKIQNTEESSSSGSKKNIKIDGNNEKRSKNSGTTQEPASGGCCCIF